MYMLLVSSVPADSSDLSTTSTATIALYEWSY